MGNYTVTLRFGDEFVDVECGSVQIAADADDAALTTAEVANDIPSGYVRLHIAQGWDFGNGAGPAMLGYGNTALVDDDRVVLIQWED